MLLSKTMLVGRTIGQLKMHLSIRKHNFYAKGNGIEISYICIPVHAAHMYYMCVVPYKTWVCLTRLNHAANISSIPFHYM